MSTKLKEVPQILVRNYLSHVATCLISKPAVGKTTMIHHFAERMRERQPEQRDADGNVIDPGFQFWQFYAPSMSPMDIIASAPDETTRTLRNYANAAFPNAYWPNGDKLKGVVFFDELFNTDPATAKLLQKYINGEDISGVLRKPDGVLVVAAGNRLEDRSGVQMQGRAFMSRFEQHLVYSEAEDNLEHMTKAGFHPNVVAFLNENPGLIDNYDEVFDTEDSRNASTDAGSQQRRHVASEEGKRGIWANMRTWQRVSDKEHVAEAGKTDLMPSEVTGNVGSAVGSMYIGYKKMLGRLASMADVLADPMAALAPTKSDEQLAMAMMLALRCSHDQIETLRKYMGRLAPEIQVVFLRTLTSRPGFLAKLHAAGDANTKAYRDWLMKPEFNAMVTGKA